MKAYEGVNVQIHAFLTLATLPLGERAPNTHWIGDHVGLRAGLEVVDKSKFSYPARNSTPTLWLSIP
jgi:hypothetical protein